MSSGGETDENVPIVLTFNDVGVTIGDRVVLKNVSGKVKPGEMLAVMGPSGTFWFSIISILSFVRLN